MADEPDAATTTAEKSSVDGGSIDEEALAAAYEEGLAAEKAGRRDAAATAYHRALAIDPADRCGASVRLAAIDRGPSPETAPPAYVATLFDQHAAVFDHILVEQLGYDAPLQLRDLIDRRLGPDARFERMLDLGCGTGLCAEALEGRADHVTGVDLSEEMVAIADEKEIYDALFVGDATAFLIEAAAATEEPDPSWSLIAATDVLPYLGALDGFLGAVAARMPVGGVFAASSESLPADAFAGAPYRVGPKHRYAHAEDYLREACEQAGLSIRAMEPIIVRYDEGEPIRGFLILAMRR